MVSLEIKLFEMNLLLCTKGTFIYGRGVSANPKIACIQNVPPSEVANYVFALLASRALKFCPPPPCINTLIYTLSHGITCYIIHHPKIYPEKVDL